MIKPQPSFLFQKLFDAYIQLMQKWHFRSHQIQLDGFYDNTKSVVMIANHFSWWDGFWCSYLMRKTLGKQFYVMMLKHQLKKHAFLRKLGAFSIEPGSKSILESLDFAQQLLQSPQNGVLIFPQGRFQPLASGNQFQFQKGIERLLNKMGDKVQLVFVHNQLEFGPHPKPTIFHTIKVVSPNFLDISALANAYKQFAQNEKRQFDNLISLENS